MYEILGLIYIGQIVQNLKDFLSIFGIIMFSGSGFFYVFFKVEMSEKKKIIKQMRNFVIISISALFITIFIPNKEIFYAMAGVKASKLTYEKNSKLIDKVIKLAEKKIDEELKETK